MAKVKDIYPGVGKKKWPGQNDKNKATCYVSRHHYLKWCAEYLKFWQDRRIAKNQMLSERRTQMHAKRNEMRRKRKESLNAG